MKELENIGKMISIFIIIVLYGSGWEATAAFLGRKKTMILE